MTGPPTPPPTTITELQDAARAEPVAEPPPQTALSTEHDPYRNIFPTIAELASHYDFTRLIQTAENSDLNVRPAKQMAISPNLDVCIGYRRDQSPNDAPPGCSTPGPLIPHCRRSVGARSPCSVLQSSSLRQQASRAICALATSRKPRTHPSRTISDHPCGIDDRTKARPHLHSSREFVQSRPPRRIFR